MLPIITKKQKQVMGFVLYIERDNIVAISIMIMIQVYSNEKGRYQMEIAIHESSIHMETVGLIRFCNRTNKRTSNNVIKIAFIIYIPLRFVKSNNGLTMMLEPCQ